MERDIDEIKPRKWLVIILIIIAILISVLLINKIVTDKKTQKEETGTFDIFNFFTEGITKIESSFGKDSFNSSFEFFVGTKTGTNVSTMIDEIVTNNKKNSDHLINVKYNDINTTDVEIIKNIKNGVKTFDKYEISVDYNEKGYVDTITIELKEKDKTAAKGFNVYYEMYNGTEYGSSVKNLLDKIVTNNKTNQNNILAVIYNETNTTDVEEIKSLKNKLDDWTKYEVSLNYNEDGYIYEIVIE